MFHFPLYFGVADDKTACSAKSAIEIVSSRNRTTQETVFTAPRFVYWLRCVWNHNRSGFDSSLNRSHFFVETQICGVKFPSFWLKWFEIFNLRTKFDQFMHLTYFFPLFDGVHSMNCHRNGQRNRKENPTYAQFTDKNEWRLRWTEQHVETMERAKEARKGEQMIGY